MRDIEEDMPTNQNVYQGICMTCNHAPFCEKCRTPGQVIWYCEMFDDSVLEKEEAPSEKLVENSEKNVLEKEPTNLKLSGLCVNCRKRNECRLPGVEGGIWHCEEYE